VLAVYRRAGYRRVRVTRDVRRLALWEVDELSEWVVGKYAALGVGLGLGAALLGPLGLHASALLSALLALRAVDETAIRYGYDARSPRERPFLRSALAVALHDDGSLEDLAHSAVAWARAWRRWTRAVPVAVTLGLARAGLAARDVRSTLDIRALVLAAANAWLLAGVARSARSAYRERFLSSSRSS
jgi:hypothetical protein